MLWAETALTRAEKGTIYDLNHTVKITTANGIVDVTQAVRVYSKELGLTVHALLMEGNTCVLSLGELCTKDEYDFVWRHGRYPFLERDGRRIYCNPTNNVPHVCVASEDERPALESDIPPTAEVHQINTEPDSEGPPDMTDSSDSEADLAERRSVDCSDGEDCCVVFEDQEVAWNDFVQGKMSSDKVAKAASATKAPTQETDRDSCETAFPAKRPLRSKTEPDHYMTHFPKDPDCEICNSCKTQRAQCRNCLLYTSPSPRDQRGSRKAASA